MAVAETGKDSKAKRALPRISKAGGGPMRGIDPGDLSTIQPIDDLDTVRRMKRFK
ncbi:MAG: hypothetical protein ACLPKB_02475 [Xanthobacteraceae bacterium]